MKLHKPFILKLAELRDTAVYIVLDKMGMFVWEKDGCKAKLSSLDEIDEICNTLDFLIAEDYVEEGRLLGHSVPHLGNYINIPENKISHLLFTQGEFERYYGLPIKVRRSIYGFIEDGFYTNKQRKEFAYFYLPIGVAVLSSVLTALLTALFPIWIK